MIHLIQKGVFAERHYEMLVDTLDRLDIPWYNVIIKDGRLMFDTMNGPMEMDRGSFETSNVFCWGSIKLAHLASENEWRPGSFMNENHDQQVYAKVYGDEMLNSDGLMIRFSEAFDAPSPIFFARPCKDTKAFTGQCFMKESWDEFVKASLDNGHRQTLNENTMVQIASRKDIQREFRAWVVNGKVITASQYKIGNRVVHERCTEPQVMDYAQRMADLYCPAKAFVMDVCMIESGMKIVEVNCINCSGFYDTDIQKLVASLEDAFNEE